MTSNNHAPQDLPTHEFTCPALRRIWGSPDALLLIFAGGAAEFAVIKAVDWLFFTNALPQDPLGRFFETVKFARPVFFGSRGQAMAAISTVNRIHQQVETGRGDVIPDWAYRDVLFILIDYGERAHTVVYGPMTPAERQAHFEALLAVGQAMHLRGLPASYAEYCRQRHRQLLADYAHTPLSERLNAAYRTALGPWRYWLLCRLQACLIPHELRPITRLRPHWLTAALLRAYRHLPFGGNKLHGVYGLLFAPPIAAQIRNLAHPSLRPRWR